MSVIKIEMRADERPMSSETICSDCGRILTGSNIIVCFCDEHGGILQDGFVCADCADENEKKLIEEDETYEAKKHGEALEREVTEIMQSNQFCFTENNETIYDRDYILKYYGEDFGNDIIRWLENRDCIVK